MLRPLLLARVSLAQRLVPMPGSGVHMLHARMFSTDAGRAPAPSSAADTPVPPVGSHVPPQPPPPSSAPGANTAPPTGWIDRYMPSAVRPYLKVIRIDKPIGTMVLLWPCWWSIGLAAPAGHWPDLKMLALFGTGALIMRGAGCIINDMWDRNFDRQVERTKTRPLASGQLNLLQAMTFLGANLSAGLAVLLSLNRYSIALGASSLLLVVTYPLMKRITYWPQAVLGLAMNWGALLGWSAVQGSCNWPVCLSLYAGGVAWTLHYDTIYAHQDKKDDVRVGVRSTALRLGARTKPFLALFSSAALAGITAAGAQVGLAWPFYACMAGGAAHLLWQIRSVDLDSPADCARKFTANQWFGALVFGGIVLGKLLMDAEDGAPAADRR